MRTSAKTKKKGRKRAPVAPARMPGLNFDSFEHEAERHEGAYGTDRAPTYQARYAAESPRRYVRRLLDWMRGRPKRASVRRPRRASSRRPRSRARRGLH